MHGHFCPNTVIFYEQNRNGKISNLSIDCLAIGKERPAKDSESRRIRSKHGRFWAHRRLGMSTTEIASKLRISQPAVSRSSKRGEQIENEHRFELIPQKA
jgi:hypothetical protein